MSDSSPSKSPALRRTLVIAALGVVYGDIGTSPLYAVRQALNAFGGVTEAAVMGALSLVAWALILVVTVKYMFVIMRADNRGEGGLLALTALTLRNTTPGTFRHTAIMTAGLVGAALFYGDGVITPSISVLSAVEGLKIATPLFDQYVIPIAVILIIGLFAFQNRGTATMGRAFGPVMLLWFSVLAVLGVINIVAHPNILLALNPLYGINLLISAPLPGFIMLGAVFLVVTGGETLYADMGHFGRAPMRTAWLYIVFPALLLNYYGQGALLLNDAAALENPFYLMAPAWAIYPLVVLAGIATIIASQAVISGAFSITRQAVQLGYLPRFRIRHTSEEEIGQVYVPRINGLLPIGIIALIVGFGSSDNLASAYGIAVTGMMTITTMLAFVYARVTWKWNLPLAVAVFGFFGAIDLAFLSANLLKIADGGWLPVSITVVMFAVMSTWWRGRRMLWILRAENTLPLSDFVANLKPDKPLRVPGTAIFMTANIDSVPTALLHALKHYKVLHERTVLMKVLTEDIPHVAEADRLEVKDLGKGFHTITVRYGFMDQPNLLRAIAQCRVQHLHFNLMETSFIVGREKLISSKRRTALSGWRKKLFMLMSNNALDATEFFRIPANRVVELGGQIEI